MIGYIGAHHLALWIDADVSVGMLTYVELCRAAALSILSLVLGLVMGVGYGGIALLHPFSFYIWLAYGFDCLSLGRATGGSRSHARMTIGGAWCCFLVLMLIVPLSDTAIGQESALAAAYRDPDTAFWRSRISAQGVGLKFAPRDRFGEIRIIIGCACSSASAKCQSAGYEIGCCIRPFAVQ